MTASEPIQTYRAFWLHYLREHSRPETRAVHFAGTALSGLCLFALFVSGNAWFVPAALLAGYGPAWFAHFFLERNHPATFRHPLWSLFSDIRMAWAWASGQLDSELEKAGIPSR